MSLYFKFVENIATFEQLVANDPRPLENKMKSIERFKGRFVEFWEEFKEEVLAGGHSFYFVIDNENHLPDFLAIYNLNLVLSESKTVDSYEEIVAVMREMNENDIAFKVVARNGGLSYLQLVPKEEIYDEFDIINDPTYVPPEGETPLPPWLMEIFEKFDEFDVLKGEVYEYKELVDVQYAEILNIRDSIDGINNDIEEKHANIKLDVLEANSLKNATEEAAANAQEFAQNAENDRILAELASLNAQSSALTVATWANLSALTSSIAGTGAEVVDGDTGTHIDPVSGTSVPNAGRYSWSVSPAGWQRIGNTGLSSKASISQYDDVKNSIGGIKFSEIETNNVSFVIADSDGNSSVVELDSTGNFTDRALTKIADGIIPKIPEVDLSDIISDISSVTAEVDVIQQSVGDMKFSEIETPNISFVIADDDGNSSVIELDETGNFTDRAKSIIAENTIPFLPETGLNGVTVGDLPTESDISFVITDSDGNNSDIELDSKGQFTDRVLDRMFGVFETKLTPVDLWKNPPARIVTIGDSLTAGAGGTTGFRWREVLTNMLNIPHDPMGVGGETARTITARTSAIPFLATFPSGMIPATVETVEVKLTFMDGLSVNPLNQGTAGVNPVSILGITGNLTRDSNSGLFYFTRSVAGDAVNTYFPEMVTTNAWTAYRDNFPIIGIGQNGGYVDIDDLIRQNKAIINWTSQGRANRYLVWTRTGVNAATNLEMETRYANEFGPRFVNIRSRLSSLWAFEINGLTPTADDLTAISTGAVPPTMRSDSVHHNMYGQKVLAVSFAQAGRSLKFWSY